MKRIKTFKLFALLLSVIIAASALAYAVSAGDGQIDQDASHENEVSMYKYDIDIYLENPCNSGDMDDDAVCELWFDFSYASDNGYGTVGTYRFDMSWDDSKGRNLNDGILKKTFIRPNDNGCMAWFSVWVPGIVSGVSVHLNMDGGERLAFTVESISLNGYRINTNTDYVSSAFYDSDAKISCRAPGAAIMSSTTAVSQSTDLRDQFGGLFSVKNTGRAAENAKYGDFRLFYHYSFIIAK